MKLSKFRLLMAVLALNLVSVISPAAPFAADSSPALPANDSPEGAVLRMMNAYAQGRLDEYSAMLTADYTFRSWDPDFAASSPDGFSRVDEIISAGHLFHGFTDAHGVVRPRAVSIRLDIAPLEQSADAPTDDYEGLVVCTPDLRMVMAFENGTRMATGGSYEFRVVRGEFARMSEDRAPEAGAWYVRGCTERPEGACRAVVQAATQEPASRAFAR